MENRIMHATLLLIALIFQVNSAIAEEKVDVFKLLKAKMEHARGPARELTIDIRITDEQLKEADPHKVLALLAPYEKDSEWPVRHMTHYCIVRVANIHPTTQVRQEVAKRLVEAEINGTDRGAFRLLMDFASKDFNDQSKALIRQALTQANIGKVGGDPSIWLCGVANMQDQLPHLKKLLIKEVAYRSDPKMRHLPKWYYTSGWAARLARARMGVKEDIDKCLELVDTVENVDRKVTILLHHVGYIRQSAAIEYLKRYFLSDLRLSATNPGGLGEPVSNYLMPILADCLSNFPVKKRKARSYTKEEIELCRKWMSEQKKWVIIR